METIAVLHGEIEQRCQTIAASHVGWPCRKGCDLCCRRLAQLPELTLAEWDLVQLGLDVLPAAVRREALTRARTASEASAGPYTCPFLEFGSGACLIYERRPVACRTYGFYVERDQGLYCGGIKARVDQGEYAEVVWGNQAVIDARLTILGEKVSLRDWIRQLR